MRLCYNSIRQQDTAEVHALLIGSAIMALTDCRVHCRAMLHSVSLIAIHWQAAQGKGDKLVYGLSSFSVPCLRKAGQGV